MDRVELGKKLKIYRGRAGLNQEDMGRALGKSHVFYGKLERGVSETPPTIDQLMIMAKTFDVPVESLMGAEDFILSRYTDEEQEVMKNPKSTQYIKAAIAKLIRDEELAEEQRQQRAKDERNTFRVN